MKILLGPGINGFVEDKDEARKIRMNHLMPALDRKEKVILDFSEVQYATQSYVHVLIGEALQKHGEEALDLLEFKGCSPQLRSLVELVVDYSLSGFPKEKTPV